MGLYRYYLRSKTGLQMGSHAVATASDAEARDIGLNFLRQDPNVQCLEAWEGADLAFRLSRCDLTRGAFNPPGAVRLNSSLGNVS